MHLSFFNKNYAVRHFCNLSFSLHYALIRFFIFSIPILVEDFVGHVQFDISSLELKVKKCLFRQAYISVLKFKRHA